MRTSPPPISNWKLYSGYVTVALGSLGILGSAWMLFTTLPQANRQDNGMAAMGAGIVAGVEMLVGIVALACLIVGVLLILAASPPKNQPASAE